MAAIALPSAEYLRECFIYRPRIGDLRWRKSRPREHFIKESGWLNWSKNYAGKTAGCFNGKYMKVRLGGQTFSLHRIIWKMTTGNDPKEEIDHRNGDKIDNRWSNLREATRQQNIWNSKRRNGRALPRGVYWNTKNRRYIAVSRQAYLGYFDTVEEAARAFASHAKSYRGDFYRA